MHHVRLLNTSLVKMKILGEKKNLNSKHIKQAQLKFKQNLHILWEQFPH